MPINPPITDSNIPHGWNANPVFVVLTVNEPAETRYTLDGSDPFTSSTAFVYDDNDNEDIERRHITAEGITVFTFASKNLSNVLNLNQVEQVKIDYHPPVTTLAAVPSEPDGLNGWYITQPQITLSAIDPVSGVDAILYSWNGGPLVEYTGPITVPSHGSHYLTFYARDNASNVETAHIVNFRYDPDAPVTFASVPTVTVTEPPVINFISSDDASGVMMIYYTIDGSTPVIEAPGTFSVPYGESITVNESGTYTLKYFSVDRAGNQESVKSSIPFTIDVPEPTGLYLTFIESFPMNGDFGWYRASPYIRIDSDKPQLVDKLFYKVNLTAMPTTAKFTSTVQISSPINVFDRNLISLQIDGADPIEIDISGIDIHNTTITEIIDSINNAYGGDIPIASETNASGAAGTGYITITSPTGGQGVATSEVKFLAPTKNDGTELIFGLDDDSYPHTFTETILYQEYSDPFLITGQGIFTVTAYAVDVNGDESERFSKQYMIDTELPTTELVIDSPSLSGFYTSAVPITFNVVDPVSGGYKTYFQFDDEEIVHYDRNHPIFIPPISGVHRLRYYSRDVAGNNEALHEVFFNYDDQAPHTSIDILATNFGQPNIQDIAYSANTILDFNPNTHEFTVPAPDDRLPISYQYGWTNDIHTFVYDESNIAPNILVNQKLRIYLRAEDDHEHEVESETTTASELEHRLITVHGPVKHVIRVYNVTQDKDITSNVQYFSGHDVFIVPTLVDPTPFVSSDSISIDYVYTDVQETHYFVHSGINDDLLFSGVGNVIDLVESGKYKIKFYSIDVAGNQEDPQTYPAVIEIIDRSPSVDLTSTPNTGLAGWHVTPPTLTVTAVSPEGFILDQLAEPYAGGGTPSSFEITVSCFGRLDHDEDEIVSVIYAKNLTTNETYTVESIVSNLDADDKFVVELSGTAVPQPTDIIHIDYSFRTQLVSGDLLIGATHFPFDPDVVFNIPMNQEGAINVVATVVDARDIEGDDSDIIKLDTVAPSATDDAPAQPPSPPYNWSAGSVTVNLNALDPAPGSGVSKIYYTTDGSTPTTSSPFILGGSGNVIISGTGVFTIKYFAADVAGNQGSVQSSDPVHVDNEGPETTIFVVSPDGQNGWYITNPSITLSAADGIGVGVDKIRYAWDNGSFVDYTAPFSIVGQGIHTLKFFSIDLLGNEEVLQTMVFKLDEDDPVSSDDVGPDWTNNGLVNFSVIDASSPTFRIYYTLDGSVPTLASAYTDDLKILVPSSGVYTLQYFAVDESGRQESPKTAVNQLMLDLEAPTLDSMSPNTVVFTNVDTQFSVTFADPLSGVDPDSIRIFIDNLEFSLTHNSSFFTISGTPDLLTATVGPVSSIPAFEVLETIEVEASDIAGNAIDPVILSAEADDDIGPYVRGTWPKNGAEDVSRDTAVSVFVDDDGSGIDLSTFRMSIAGRSYAINGVNAISVEYTGDEAGTFISIDGNVVFVYEGGRLIAEVSLNDQNHKTVKSISEFIDDLPNFSSSTIQEYDQESSLEIIPIFRLPLDVPRSIAIAPKGSNRNVNFVTRSNGFMITVMPNERFDDNFLVNVTVDASDFHGNAMTTESFSFTTREITTPPRSLRNRWDRSHFEVISQIRDRLESTYNKGSDATNFHGYLKFLALEIGRALQSAEDYRGDSYYDGGTTRPALLYQNIGYLLKMEPRARFTHEKYRQVLLALLKVYLDGSTPEAIAEAIKLFLDVPNITVREAIHDPLQDISHQFEFMLDIDLGSLSQPISNLSEVDADLKLIIKQIKPAHTAFILRYIFSENFGFVGTTFDDYRSALEWLVSEDFRSDCSGVHNVPKLITDDLSDQADDVNDTFRVLNGPILNDMGTNITFDPDDVIIEVISDDGVTVPAPVTVLSVNGETGVIVLSRPILVSESLFVTYTYNPYLAYSNTTFKLNTYVITSGAFDLEQGFLLCQPREGDPERPVINPPDYNHIVWPTLAYHIHQQYSLSILSPESMHAPFCEDLTSIDLNDTGEGDVYVYKEEILDNLHLNQYAMGNDHISSLLGDRRWVLWGGLGITSPHVDVSLDQTLPESADLDPLDESTAIASSTSEDPVDTAIDHNSAIAISPMQEESIDILKNHNFMDTNNAQDLLNSENTRTFDESENTEFLYPFILNP